MNNLIIDIEGEKMTVTLDYVKVYKFLDDTTSSQMSNDES